MSLVAGASTPTVFLDIRTRILSGGDGTVVIAEYHTSEGDPNVADSSAETRLLTIPHPTNANHNGGMLAFSPLDRFLYIGVGDGGGANAPPNNAQNIDVLLGKILRIDVDHPDPVGGTLYSSPGGNPYINVAGRDEIFAIGMRNPWRFSFDSLTSQQWVADVGQGSREEVDTPIIAGANYGWRVYEGTLCTNNDPLLCNPNNYTFPVFDYIHAGGRCSITGGYAYRGSQGALPAGTYIYGDYCSGEILTWDGSVQTLMLDTTLNISSFGEGEQGDLYVVGLGGTISRVDPVVACSFSIAPSSASYAIAGGTGSVAVTAAGGCGWNAASNASWIHVTAGANGNGNGTVNYSVDSNSGVPRNGTMTIAGKTFSVAQDGVVTCTFSISPTRVSFPAAGGSGTVSVTAPQGCDWTAVSNAPWISITGSASGTGTGVVNYSVAVYTGKPKNRNGTMTIAGANFSVKQSK